MKIGSIKESWKNRCNLEVDEDADGHQTEARGKVIFLDQ